ncbi:MAG TPA: hypothetical protein VJP87_12565 [Candidatus Acidoferrales bacterium]|nr:hypothetical protein [Candidatus Acidoferrales bacterium]
MSLHGQSDWRKAWACVLLLAAFLLYAPLVVTAWSANAACCNSDHCPIPSHHHKKAPTTPQDGMNCEHGMQMPGMASCSMACCQTAERDLLIPANFVLPPVVALYAPSAARQDFTAQRVSTPQNSRQPLSPPPRLQFAAI